LCTAVEKKRKAQTVQLEDEDVICIEMPDGTQVKPEEVQGMTLKGIYQANALQDKAIASSEATAANVASQREKKLKIEYFKIMLQYASDETRAGLIQDLSDVMSAPGVTNRATEAISAATNATEATEANSAAQGPILGG
jgi:hypothetical protein